MCCRWFVCVDGNCVLSLVRVVFVVCVKVGFLMIMILCNLRINVFNFLGLNFNGGKVVFLINV